MGIYYPLSATSEVGYYPEHLAMGGFKVKSPIADVKLRVASSVVASQSGGLADCPAQLHLQ